MDTTKIIKGVVNSGRYTVTAPIVKEDYGLYLQIEGVELPSTYEVDFSNSEHNGTSVTMIGNSDGVLIPHQFIDTGKDVFAFLYHVGENFGRTVYKFRIPNKVRPDRTDDTPTPEQASVIDQAISALNEAVAQTAQDVEQTEANVSHYPTVVNGYWNVYDAESETWVSTGVKAEGTDGVGISSIAKTGTSGLVDTYTITFSDGTTTTYTVTNGSNGTNGRGITSIAKTSTSGLVDTYTITYTDGTTTTFMVTNGQDGEVTEAELNSAVSQLNADLSQLGYTTKSILVDSGTAHNATADKIPFVLASGEIFNITALASTSGRVTVRVYGFANATDTTGTIISNSLALDVGKTAVLTSNGTYEYIGLFWGASWTSITANVTFRVGREDSVLLEIEETTQRSQDNENRINNIESLTPNNIPYSTVATDWHSGTIDTTTGANSGTSTKRIRLNGYINISGIDNINISTSDNVDCIVYFYDATQTYLSATGWVNDSRATVPTGAEYIRVSLRYTDNTTISVNDVANNLFTVSYNNPLIDAVEPIKDMPSYIYDTDDLTGKINIDAVRTAYANFANTYSGDIGEAFVFLTDPHPYYVTDTEMVKRFYATIAKAFNQIPTGFVVSGGDWLTDGMTQAEACSALGYITAIMMRITQGRFYPLLGNHDMNIFGSGENPTLSYGAIITTMFPVQGKAYYHFNGANTSFYCIDTGSDHDTTMTAYRWTQMQWLAESLLHDTAEHIGILEHIYAVNTIDNVYPVASKVNQIITAFNARQTVDVNGNTYDYTTKTGRVEFVVAGHAHKEMSGYINGIPVIVCNRSFTASIIGFDAILVDYTNRTINFLRTNTGAIRSITLDS